MVLPLSSCGFRPGRLSMAQGAERHYISQQAEVPPFTESPPHSHAPDCNPGTAIGSWADSPGADAMMPCQQLGYADPWTVGTTQSYGAGPCDAPGQFPLEADGHAFDFSLSSLPDTTGSFSNTSQLRRESRSLSGCRDSLDWVCKSNASDLCRFEPDSSASPKPVGSSGQHSEGALASNTIGLASPSPAFSVPSTHSLQFNNPCSPSAKSPPDHAEMRASSGPEEDGTADPPYSLLIYQALRSAPGMKLPLQGIYSWFEKNTEKGKDQSSKGWQNSIRHNLSMNAGFEAVKEETAGGKKAVNFWRLTDAAVKNGIQSTTRYRKQANCRKALCLEPPAPQRQRSGARGGKAAKVTARYRHNHHDELRRERHYRTRATAHRRPEKNIYLQNPTTVFPLGVPSPVAPMGHSIETFDLRHVVGCTDYSPTTPIFSDMDAAESDYFSLGIGSLGWCGIHPATSGGFWGAGPEISTDLHVGV